MKWVKYYSLLIFLFVFQTVLGDSIRVFGILPDLMFVLAVCVALKEDRFPALIFALVSGILKDYSLMLTFGLNGFIMLYVAFAISFVTDKFFYPTIFVNAIFTFVAGFLYQSLYFFLRFTMWGEERIFYPVAAVIMPECLYNTILSFLVFGFCAFILGEKVFSFKTVRRGFR